MLGLALSVGASGSILSCHNRNAVAAEPKVQASTSSVEGLSDDAVVDSVSSESRGVSVSSSGGSHIVREGETLWTIASLYGMSSESLLDLNGLSDTAVLRVGQRLTVALNVVHHAEAHLESEWSNSGLPTQRLLDSKNESSAKGGLQVEVAASHSSVVVKLQPVKAEFDRQHELVNSGEEESLTSEDLDQKGADISSESLSSHGSELQEVVLPESTSESTLHAQHVAFSDVDSSASSQLLDTDVLVPTTHQIRVGETLADIARQYSISTEQLAEVNRIRNPNRIFAGRILTLPEGSVSSTGLIGSTESISPNSVVAAALDDGESPSLVSLSSDRVDSFPDAYGSVSPERLLEADEARSVVSDTPVDSEFYVSRLLGEIEKLSEDYRSESSERVTESDTVLINEDSGSVGSEVVAYVPGIEATPQELSPISDVPLVIESTVESSSVDTPESMGVSDYEASDEPPELVAVAPLGSENYVPLNEPVTGRMVSPDLPPLAGPENYLPSGSSSFNGYVYPAQGTLTSGYGWRWGRMHRGIDVAAPIGTPIVAAAPGVIEYSGWNSGGYGNMVEVRHPDGSMTRYAHNSRNLVRVGQQVSQGEQIAEMGSTGYSTGPHVHFEIHMPDQGTVDPVAYLSE